MAVMTASDTGALTTAIETPVSHAVHLPVSFSHLSPMVTDWRKLNGCD